MQNHSTFCTASTIHAILCYLNPINTPKIAYNNDELTIPLINKLKSVVINKDGSQEIALHWSADEYELEEQFAGVIKNIHSLFEQLNNIYNV